MQTSSQPSAPIIADNSAPAQHATGGARNGLLPILASALLMTLAFPPVDAGFLAWIGLAPLFHALPQARSAMRAFARGYLFGFAHWGAVVYWIGTTVVNWAHTPLGWLAWLGLTAILSGWFGLFGLLAWKIDRYATRPSQFAFGTAAAWTLVEWLRGLGSVAMPWGLIGYTQYRYLPLIQAADLGGVYVISFALALTNAAVAESVRCSVFGYSGAQDSKRPFLPSSLPPFLPALVCIGLMLAYGAFSLARAYDGPAVTLALMQTNRQSERSERPLTAGEWAERVREELARIRDLSARVMGGSSPPPFLVVWPESAAPGDAVNDPALRGFFSDLARTSRAYHLVGTGYEDAQGRPANSAALFTPDGRLVDRYDKIWLVPYGEWIPLRPLMESLRGVFHFLEEDLVPGTREEPLTAGPIRMSVLICYETVSAAIPRRRAMQGANLLVSITNDSWAGRSAELQQHIAMAVLRAVETRRFLASSTTTGITGLIAPTGAMEAIPPHQESAMMVAARLLEGQTLYARGGDWFVALCALGLLVLFCQRRQRRCRPA